MTVPNPPQNTARPSSDAPFIISLLIIGGLYVALILAMLLADVNYLKPLDSSGIAASARGILQRSIAPLRTPEIRFSLQLSLISCTVTAILSLWFSVPLGYLMSRFQFPFKGRGDAILDIPIVLPPVVIGLSLLILFQSAPGKAIEKVVPFTYAIGGVILAQFAVSCAFAVRTMRVTFDQINPRKPSRGCADARLHAQPGVLARGVAGRQARDAHRRHARLKRGRDGRAWARADQPGDAHAYGGVFPPAFFWNRASATSSRPSRCRC